ncbi:PQQ-binding-like beta-propeller repeat protein, partial [Bacteroidota bacterium]
WKHSVSDWVRSKPLVIGDMVYVVTMDGNLYALHDNGSKAEELMQTRVNEHGFAADLEGSEKGILAAGRDLILYSIFPETFNLNWKHGILDGTWIAGEFYRAGWTGGLQPSPTIVDGTLYCGGMDGFVHALDAESGEEIWRFEGDGTCGASITVAKDKVFFGYISGKGVYYALDKNTGKLIWQTEEYGNVWVGAAYNAGKLFFGNMDGMMYGVDAGNGRKLWSHDTSKDTPKENWRNMNKRGHGWPPGIYPVPVSDATNVYIGSWSGYYFAFDQETGKVVWRTQTNNGNLEGGLPDSAAPVLWGDHVYVQKIGHILAALNRETGKVEWEWEAPMMFLQNGTVAAHDDKIFGSYTYAVTRIPYNSTIIAFDDVENGSAERWTYKGGAGLTAPVICDGKLISGSSADPFMVCLDPDDGSVLWRMFTGGEMLENVPAIYGNKVYAHFNTGWLYAIK